MAGKVFSFEGHISAKVYAPRIDVSSFESLPINSILMGTVDHIMVGNKHPKAQILINGQRLELTLWDKTDDEARAMIGQAKQIVYTGINDNGYPSLMMLDGYIAE